MKKIMFSLFMVIVVLFTVVGVYANIQNTSEEVSADYRGPGCDHTFTNTTYTSRQVTEHCSIHDNCEIIYFYRDYKTTCIECGYVLNRWTELVNTTHNIGG